MDDKSPGTSCKNIKDQTRGYALCKQKLCNCWITLRENAVTVQVGRAVKHLSLKQEV